MIGEVTFGVIGLLFLFADIRTFTSTFQQTFFGAPNSQLGAMALAVFATSFIGLVVAGRLGPRRGLAASAAIFGLATFLLTASRNNVTDLALAVVALAAGMWWLAMLHASRAGDTPSPLPRALPLAFAADLALRAAFRTEAVVDVAWPVATAIALVAVLLFGAAGIATLGRERQWMSSGLAGALGLAALPCLVLVAETGATNGAQVALAAGLGLGPEPPRATQIGQVVVGLGLAAGALAVATAGPRRFVAVAALAVGAALLWSHLPFIALIGGAVLAAGLVLAAVAITGAPLHVTKSATAAILALSVGWIAFVAAAFGFYALWAYAPAVWAATAFVAVAALLAPASIARLGRSSALAAAVLAFAVPFAAFIATPPVLEPQPAKQTFTLMTYNIHQGFSAGQVPALEDLLATIHQEEPEVLVLQEVVRGWMIDEQHDALSVIAERLGMYYVYQGNIGDLYGNAVLSRFPMEVVKRVSYAPPESLKHQPRGALFVRTSGVLLIATHLDEFRESSLVRQEQVRTIIREWGTQEKPVLIAGDLNAGPGDIEVRLLGEAGFDDLGRELKSTTIGEEPARRIDYVWGIGVAAGQARTVCAPNASDHCAVVMTITLKGK